MGPIASKQITKQNNNLVTDILTDVIIDISSRCNTSSLNKQSINNNVFQVTHVSNSSIDVALLQDLRLSLNSICTSSNKTQTELIQKFESKLKSIVEQKIDGLGITNTNKINKINNIVYNIMTNINMKSLTECIAKVSNDQEMFNNLINYSFNKNLNIKLSLAQTVVNNIINNCVLSNDSLIQSITELEKTLDDETTQSTTGFNLNDAISKIADGISSTINNMIDTIGLIGVLIIGGVIVLLLFAPKLLCIIPGSQFLISGICSSNKNQTSNKNKKDKNQTSIN